jgi:cell division cycle 2-like protein
MEWMPTDLKQVLKNTHTAFTLPDAKAVLQQLLRALADVHAAGYAHRDLKPSNILVNEHGDVKLADFGSARYAYLLLCLCYFLVHPRMSCFSNSSYRRMVVADPKFTCPVVTLWYRPPELLLGSQSQSFAIDVWSVGCIFAELLLGRPLFTDTGEVPLLGTIFSIYGIPDGRHPIITALIERLGMVPRKAKSNVKDTQLWAHYRNMFPRSAFKDTGILTDVGVDLLVSLLALDPSKRISAVDALNHQFFDQNPLPTVRQDVDVFFACVVSSLSLYSTHYTAIKAIVLDPR